jgi:hypothetical protein
MYNVTATFGDAEHVHVMATFGDEEHVQFDYNIW